MNRLIVSFTSYPERISTVNCVLNSLYAQTRKADEIILWLAKEQFPNREADLPISLQDDLDALCSFNYEFLLCGFMREQSVLL